MKIPKIDNLKITEVTNDLWLIHQIKPPYYFSCCDGLIILPMERNESPIILDLNIEPKFVIKICKGVGIPSHYICTHGHMDHIAHVHQWEKLGTKVLAPYPEHEYLLDLEKFFTGFGWNESMDFSFIEKFAKLNGYQSCTEATPFSPGLSLKVDDNTIETIPLFGHSKAHTGFFLPKQKVLHISCLGFDQLEPGLNGFGPWYGFEECSIEQYFKDIELTERIFREKSDFLTSSHSYVVSRPDFSPFEYMKNKIKNNQIMVDQAILSLKEKNLPVNTNNLLDLDIFFPKKKMDSFRKSMWSFWERKMLEKHLERSEYVN
jgi:glyoxylase-like metal-dependent hydrolase (beta-lactamase superfamily II)